MKYLPRQPSIEPEIMFLYSATKTKIAIKERSKDWNFAWKKEKDTRYGQAYQGKKYSDEMIDEAISSVYRNL